MGKNEHLGSLSAFLVCFFVFYCLFIVVDRANLFVTLFFYLFSLFITNRLAKT